MTYGALVVQLIQDYEDYAEVNKQLEKMGYNIGTRLIEDFLARSNLGRCADFRETGEVVSKVCVSSAVGGQILCFLSGLSNACALFSLLRSLSLAGWVQVLPEHYSRCNAQRTTTSVLFFEIVNTTTAIQCSGHVLHINLRRESFSRIR